MENGNKVPEKLKYQHEGLKWLYEMELVTDPQLINNLKINVFSISNGIKEAEFIVSEHQKAILAWIDLGWFHKKFKGEQIKLDVYERLKQLLPSFKFRVVTDREIFDMSLNKLDDMNRRNREIIERSIANDNADSKPGKSELQKEPNSVSDSKEQSKSEELSETVESDSEGVKETQDPS
jgi:hypothetical protein